MPEAIINFAAAADQLFTEQVASWEQCKIGYNTLQSVQTRLFEFAHAVLKVQFNPGRMLSTSAKVDAKSINERKCFLCAEQLPEAQKSVRYKNDFLILVNPFPIFSKHFTLPSISHQPQLIKDSFGVFLDFCRDLSPLFTLFYNGPRCGASAPDHLHFQAGTKHFMPVESEYDTLLKFCSAELFSSPSVKVFSVDDQIRKMIFIEGREKFQLEKAFAVVHATLQEFTNEAVEPMMNIVGSWAADEWRIIVFLRKKHRPQIYFEENDEKKILLSPAAVDISGVCITPREKDFQKFDAKLLQEIFQEVFFPEDEFSEFTEQLKIALR